MIKLKQWLTFLNVGDFSRLYGAPAKNVNSDYVSINGFVWSVRSEVAIKPGQLGLGNVHRRTAQLAIGDTVQAQKFDPLASSVSYLSCIKLEADFFTKSKVCSNRIPVPQVNSFSIPVFLLKSSVCRLMTLLRRTRFKKL